MNEFILFIAFQGGLNNTGMGNYFNYQSYYKKQKNTERFFSVNTKLIFSQISENTYKIEFKEFFSNSPFVEPHIFIQTHFMHSSAFVKVNASNHNIIRKS